MFDTLTLPPTIAPLRYKHERSMIAGGSIGTAQTIRRMQQLVADGKRDVTLRRALGQILSGGPVGGFTEKDRDGGTYTIPLNHWRGKSCPPKDHYCYAEQIFRFCRDGIRYVYDPHGVELLERPRRILMTGIADCDSICVLFASLCEAAGMPTRFLTVKADPSRPKEYSHVLCEVNVPKHGWIAADCTQTRAGFGWRPPPMFPAKAWPSSHETMLDAGADMFSGLSEGYVPGVRYAGPFTQTPGSDLTLRGLADLASCCLPSLSGLGATAPVNWENLPAVWDILNRIEDGSLYRDLSATRVELMNQTSELSKYQLAINNMSGAAKSAALGYFTPAKAAYQKAYDNYIKARDYYNQITARWPKAYGSPKQLAGLGIAPVAIAGVAAAVGVSAYFLSQLVYALRGDTNASRGYIDQLAGLVGRVADVLDKGGGAVGGVVDKTTNLVQTLGILAAVGGLGYIGFKVLESRGYIGKRA